jgi:hypothetical protein
VFKLSEDEDVSEHEEESSEEEKASEEEKISEQKDVLSKFMRLNEKQLQVYSLVLTLGQVTIGDIAIVMRSSSDEVQNIISELERLELLTPLPGVVTRYQAVPPFDELAKEVSTIGERIEQLREELKDQLRTASMTVRDSLFDLAKENLEKIETLASQQDAQKSKAIEEIDSVMSTWSETSERAVEDSTSTIKSTIEKAKDEASGEITPAISSVKDRIVSQSDALMSEAQSWALSVKEISENLKSGLSSHINTFQEKMLQTLEDQTRAISDGISTQLDNTSSGLQNSKEIQLEQLGILKDRTAETLASLSSQIAHVLTDTQNSIGKSMEHIANNLVEEIGQVRQTFTETVEEYSTADETAIIEFDTEFEGSLDDYAGKHNQALEELAMSIESVTSNLVTQSQSAYSSISNQVDALATRSQDQMTNAMNNIRDLSVNTIQDAFKVTNNSSRTLLGETETEFSGSKERLQIVMDETSESMKTLSQHSLEGYLGLLEKTRNIIRKELGGIAERTKSRIEEFANTAVGDLEALKQSLQEQITQAVVKSSEQIQAVSASARNEIEQGVEVEIHRLSSQLDEQMTEYRAMHDTITTNIEETITEQVRQHTEMLDGLLNKATSSHERMLDEIDTMRRHSIGELDTKLSDSKSTTINSILQMKGETSEIIQTMENLIQESVGTINHKVQKAIDGERSATNTYVNSLRENRSTLITGLRTRREQFRGSITESVGASVTDSQAQLHDETATALQLLAEKSNEIKTGAQTEITSIEEQKATFLTNASDDVAHTFDTVNSAVRITLEEVKGNLSNSFGELKSGVTEHSTTMLNQLDSSLSELGSKIDVEIGQRKAIIDSASESAKEEIESVSEQLTTTIETVADSLKSESIKTITSAMESATKSVKSLKPELETALVSGYANLRSDTTAVKSALNRLLSKLEESPMLGLTEDTLDEAFAAPAEGIRSDAAAVLSKVWERVGATDFPGAKDFWTVSTRTAVLAHISDMVQRAKSKITLILAYPTEIPTEMLVELKSTTGVELVVTEGGLLTDKVRPLVGRGNIRVRTRTEMDVYACVRDSEEVLLAPVTKDDRDVIGIATEDPGFVKFVMGVVGPIFQSRTKLLRPGDI